MGYCLQKYFLGERRGAKPQAWKRGEIKARVNSFKLLIVAVEPLIRHPLSVLLCAVTSLSSETAKGKVISFYVCIQLGSVTSWKAAFL